MNLNKQKLTKLNLFIISAFSLKGGVKDLKDCRLLITDTSEILKFKVLEWQHSNNGLVKQTPDPKRFSPESDRQYFKISNSHYGNSYLRKSSSNSLEISNHQDLFAISVGTSGLMIRFV